MSQQSYLLVKLETETNSTDLDTSPEYITNNIGVSLKTIFGDLGAAIPFTVLKYCSDTRSVIISCPDTDLVKLRTAITLQNSYQGLESSLKLLVENYYFNYSLITGIDCCYSVTRVVKDLISL